MATHILALYVLIVTYCESLVSAAKLDNSVFGVEYDNQYALANPKLRILPLGDSITFGIGSTGMNGYRGDLYKLLQGAGYTVDYVGSQRSGNFGKPNHEGYSGYMINQISNKADKALTLKPNVVCLLAGTNDLAWGGSAGQDTKTAPNRLRALVEKITTKLPDTVVLVGTLPPLGKGGSGSAMEDFNRQVPIMAKALSSQNKKVVAVDLSAITKSDLKDGVHPNDKGYTIMANGWFKGIQESAAKGWIKEPAA